MDAKTFGAFLARMRKSQGLTQAELAQQLHVTDKAVSRWERGVGLPGILACPGRMAVHWRTLSNGNLQADGWLPSWVFFPLFVGIEFLTLELWNNFEQTGYYRHWGEIGASVTRSMNFCSPAVRLWKFVLDLLFFFGFGFVIPCAEMMTILIN